MSRRDGDKAWPEEDRPDPVDPEEELGRRGLCSGLDVGVVDGAAALQHGSAGEELEALRVRSLLGLDEHTPTGQRVSVQ